MSRSYRKRPLAVYSAEKSNKKYANRKVRRELNRDNDLVLKHRQYKKVYESWNINDWVCFPTSFERFYQDMLRKWEEGYPIRSFNRLNGKPPTRKWCKNLYDKWYRRK